MNRTPWLLLIALAVVGTITVVSLDHGTASSSSSASASADDVPFGELLKDNSSGVLSARDGVIPETASVFDDGIPAVAKLDDDLLAALRRAATDADQAGVTVRITSGWRSPEYQDQLLREAVGKYGSVAAASRWVAAPDKSAHVSGDAVDVSSNRAAQWLQRHGARYGLCRTYGNEVWHFQLRPDAPQQGCPAMYADPTEDPRMR
ncbi:M15 family metallopeptidase [Aeromicrobium terrae]|uniref:Peptidase M15 n=1 Tax=Aeromicrobium terrae TaxID=2498846 RepID=A0A5C8NET4_9ACTN|nr:M15 family metallopeptidase [Aeromicrobium terrae]TXL57413.1 peptidase M15 [Aeromicrobium terrae]